LPCLPELLHTLTRNSQEILPQIRWEFYLPF
jgi:hypothetical protein